MRAYLAAEIKLFPSVGEGESLAFGKVAPANGVLDHLFADFLGTCSSTFGGEKSPLDHPVEDAQKNQNDDQTVHAFSLPSSRGMTRSSVSSSARILETVLPSTGWTKSGATSFKGMRTNLLS